MSEQDNTRDIKSTSPQGHSFSETNAFWVMLLMVSSVFTAMVSIGVSVWLLREDGRNAQHQRVVFVDAKRLIDARSVELVDQNNLDISSAADDGERFAIELKAVVAELQEEGFTVINGAVLLSDNDVNDYTDMVAKRIAGRLPSAGGKTTRDLSASRTGE